MLLVRLAADKRCLSPGEAGEVPGNSALIRIPFDLFLEQGGSARPRIPQECIRASH